MRRGALYTGIAAAVIGVSVTLYGVFNSKPFQNLRDLGSLLNGVETTESCGISEKYNPQIKVEEKPEGIEPEDNLRLEEVFKEFKKNRTFLRYFKRLEEIDAGKNRSAYLAQSGDDAYLLIIDDRYNEATFYMLEKLEDNK